MFVSFKTEERETARSVKESLQERGLRVWWQEEIQCGQEWHGEIDKAVVGAGSIVVLWSNRAMASPWVKHEASQAIARSVYTPVRIDAVAIEAPYNRIQATDLAGWDGRSPHPGLDALHARIDELLPPPLAPHRRLWSWVLLWRGTLVTVLASLVATLLLGYVVQSVRSEVVLIQHAVKQVEQTVNRISRPIRDVHLFTRIDLPMTESPVANYWSRLDEAIFQTTMTQETIPGVTINGYDEFGPSRVTISSESSLWPTADRDPELTTWLRRLRVGVDFTLGNAVHSDLHLETEEQREQAFEWDLRRHSLTFSYLSSVAERNISRSGRVFSTLDFIKSNVSIYLDYGAASSSSTQPGSRHINSGLPQASLGLQSAILHVAGETFVFNGESMERRDVKGTVAFHRSAPVVRLYEGHIDITDERPRTPEKLNRRKRK